MSNNQNQIEKGKIYIVTDEPIFIYHRSDFYVTNGKVIPDGLNWHKAKTYGDTYVAIHESELHVSITAKDESGADVLCIKDRCDFLTSTKTANDPNSRINKSLRKWKC